MVFPLPIYPWGYRSLLVREGGEVITGQIKTTCDYCGIENESFRLTTTFKVSDAFNSWIPFKFLPTGWKFVGDDVACIDCLEKLIIKDGPAGL